MESITTLRTRFSNCPADSKPKVSGTNPRLISSILTFRDLHSHICQIFMRIWISVPCRAVPKHSVPDLSVPCRKKMSCRALRAVPNLPCRAVPVTSLYRQCLRAVASGSQQVGASECKLTWEEAHVFTTHRNRGYLCRI